MKILHAIFIRQKELSDLGNIHDLDQKKLAYIYFGVTRFPAKIQSPLREDKSPGCSLYLKNEKVNFKDFATGEQYPLIDLLMKMFQLDLHSLHKKLLEDISSNKVAKYSQSVLKSRYRGPYTLRCTTRQWEQKDNDYWYSYGVDPIMLRGFNVDAVKEVIYEYDTMRKIYDAEELAYVFREYKDGKESIKIYQPYGGSFKWRNNHDSSVIQLFSHLPQKGRMLMICSSLKDALCMWCNAGIPSIAPQSETTMIKHKVIEELESRFDNIYVCYDSDNAGRKGEKKMCEGTTMKPFCLPEFRGGKDVSDYYRTFGKSKFINMVFRRLEEIDGEEI